MKHNLAIIDNNEEDCLGTPMFALEHFETNMSGFGGVTHTVENLSLFGEDSIVGKYVQLNHMDGQAACCLIKTDEVDREET